MLPDRFKHLEWHNGKKNRHRPRRHLSPLLRVLLATRHSRFSALVLVALFETRRPVLFCKGVDSGVDSGPTQFF